MRPARITKTVTDLLLNSLSPAYSPIYHNKRSISLSAKEPINFIEIKKMSGDDISTVALGLKNNIIYHPKGQNLDLVTPKILQVRDEDIELTEEDKKGKIILATKDDLEILYGERGKVASKESPPSKLLTKKYVVPGGSFGVLGVDKHVPFQIKASDRENVVAIASCNLTNFLSIEDSLKRYSMDLLTDLPVDVAKRISIKIQGRIFEDRGNENFYEEVTSKVFTPTEHIRSSGTLMNFERKQFGIDNTTDSHYHPGERALLIFTTEKEAGVTLNFCGTEESPEDRKDCEVRKDFPRNSFLMKTFSYKKLFK